MAAIDPLIEKTMTDQSSIRNQQTSCATKRGADCHGAEQSL